MRVYLDTCAMQRPLDDRLRLRIRVEGEAVLGVIAAVEAGEIELVASDVLRFETENNPLPARRNFARRVLALAGGDVASTPEVLARARQYEQEGIKPLDAIHLASAVEARVAFFCTTDDGLLRKGPRLNTGTTRVVSPLELIAELEP
jgi:hypothetical protein